MTYSLCTPAPKDWICVVCRGSDPVDLVFHGGLGKLHPIHRICHLEWSEKSSLCPSCRAETAAQPFFNSLSLVTQAGIGLALTAAAWKWKLSWLAAAGLGLQSAAVQQSLCNVETYIRKIQRVELLCKELLLHFNAGNLTGVSELTAQIGKYRELLDPWLGFEDIKMKLVGIRLLQQAATRDLNIHCMVKNFRNMTGALALFFTLRSSTPDFIFRILMKSVLVLCSHH